ncbi:hypothetical protein IWZ03DRAFT_375119 [Phyllosticta citriasiana]|uniref:Uncharacterized protein n=1 Tax=Phyllosticta citriasiana TaxID=595635 RepID=A0ABR1KPX6_9PEZI
MPRSTPLHSTPLHSTPPLHCLPSQRAMLRMYSSKPPRLGVRWYPSPHLLHALPLPSSHASHSPTHPLSSVGCDEPPHAGGQAGRRAGRLLARIPATLRRWYRCRCRAGWLAVCSVLRRVLRRDGSPPRRSSLNSLIISESRRVGATTTANYHLRASKTNERTNEQQATNAKRALYDDADSSILILTCPSFTHLSFSPCVCRGNK